MGTIIITGSSGFIGYSLSKYLLDRDFKVIGIDVHNGEGEQKRLQDERLSQLIQFKKFTSIRKDLSEDLSDLKEYFNESNYVIHLAATPGVRESNRNPQKYIKNNIVAFSNVIEMAAKSSIKHFIFASSSSVYGDMNIPINGLKENMIEGNVQSVYAMTKVANEIEALVFSKKSKMQITGFRFFSVYGPYGRPDMAIWLFTDSILKNKPVKVFGKGLMKRDFTYIDDVVLYIAKVIKIKRTSSFEIYNIGSMRPQTILSLLNCIELELGRKANIIFEDKDIADVNETFANMEKYIKEYELGKDLDFTRMESGISKFCKWLIDFQRNNSRNYAGVIASKKL